MRTAKVAVAILVLCGTLNPRAATLIYDGIVFSYPSYDYAPSVMVDGSLTRFWWCGDGPGDAGDAVGYRTFNGSTWSTGLLVLQGTPGTWDEVHTCDPSVVKGSFSYGGSTYSHAMYYVGAGSVHYNYGQIGVAFSNDGATWVKVPTPVITSAGPPDGIYGAGVPTFYRFSGTPASGWMVWWDSTWPGGAQNVAAFTTDGINFGPRQLLHASVGGIIGDIAYSPTENLWYAVSGFPTPTGGVQHIYRTADPFSAWTLVGIIDQALTGNPNNHNAGFVRLPNGDLWLGAGGVKFVSFGTGTLNSGTWDLAYAHWF